MVYELGNQNQTKVNLPGRLSGKPIGLASKLNIDKPIVDSVSLTSGALKLQAPAILQQKPATPPLPPELQSIAKKNPQLKAKINDLWERYNRSDIAKDEKQQIFLEFIKLDKQIQRTKDQQYIKETKATIRKEKSYNFGPEWNKLMVLIDKAFKDGNYLLLDGLIQIADSIIKAKREISRLSEMEHKLPFGSKLRQLYFDARHALIDQARVLLNGDPQRKANYYTREYTRLMGEAKKLVDQVVNKQGEPLRDEAKALLNKLDGKTGNPLLDRALGEAGLDVTNLPANRQIIRGRAIQEKRQQASQTLYKQLFKIDPSKAQTIRKKLQDLSQRDPSKIDTGYYRELVQVQREIDHLIARGNLKNYEKGMDDALEFLGKLNRDYNKLYVREARGWMGIFARREGPPTRYAWPAEINGAASPRNLNQRIISHLYELKRTGKVEDFKKAIADLTDIKSCRTLDDLSFKLSIVRALLKADMGQYLDLPSFGRSQGKLLDWSSSQISEFLQDIKLNRVIVDVNHTKELGQIITAAEGIVVAAAVSSVGSAAVGVALGISAKTVGGFIFMTGVNAAIFTPISRFSEVAFGASEMWKTPGEAAKDFFKNWAMFAALGALGKVVGHAPKFATAAKTVAENATSRSLGSALKALGQKAGAGIKSAVSIEGVERAAHGLAALAVEFAGLNALTLIEQVIEAALSPKQKVKDVLTLENMKGIAIQNAIMLLGLKLGGHFPNTRLVGPITSEIMGVGVKRTENRIERLSVEYYNAKSQLEAGKKVKREPSLVLKELEAECNKYKELIADFNVNGIFDENIRTVDAQLKLIEAERATLTVGSNYTVRGIYLHDAKGNRVEGVRVNDNVVQGNKTYREFIIREGTLIRVEINDRQITNKPFETNINEGESIEIIIGKPNGNQPAEKLFLSKENGNLYLERPMYGFRGSKGDKVLLPEGLTTVGTGRNAKLIIPDHNLGISDTHFSIKVEGGRLSLQATGETHVRGVDPETAAKLDRYARGEKPVITEGRLDINRKVENNTYTYFTKEGNKILDIKAERDGNGQLTLSKPEIAPEFVGKPEARQALEDLGSEIQFRSDGQGKKLTAQEVAQRASAKKYAIRDGKLYENDKPQDWVTVEQKGKAINLKANILGEIRIFAQLGVVKGQLQLQPVGGGITEAQLVKMFGEARAKQIIDIQQSGVVVETPAAAKGAPSVDPSLTPFVKPGTNVVREHGVFDPQFIMSFREMSKKTPVVFVDLDGTLLQKKPGAQEVSVNPDAAAFLAGLKAKGYKVVILSTGTSDYVSGALKKTGLDGYCDLVIAREAAFDWNNSPFESIAKIDEILQKQGVNQTADDLFMGYSKGNIVGLLVEKGRAVLVDDNHGIATDRQFLEPGLGEYEAVPVRPYLPFEATGTNGPGPSLPEVLNQLPQIGTPATAAKYQIKGNTVVDQAGKPVEGISLKKIGENLYRVFFEGTGAMDEARIDPQSGRLVFMMGGDKNATQLGRKNVERIAAIKQELEGKVVSAEENPQPAKREEGTGAAIPRAMRRQIGEKTPVQVTPEKVYERAVKQLGEEPSQLNLDRVLADYLVEAHRGDRDAAFKEHEQIKGRRALLFRIRENDPVYKRSVESARDAWQRANEMDRRQIEKICGELKISSNSKSILDNFLILRKYASELKGNPIFAELSKLYKGRPLYEIDALMKARELWKNASAAERQAMARELRITDPRLIFEKQNELSQAARKLGGNKLVQELYALVGQFKTMKMHVEYLTNKYNIDLKRLTLAEDRFAGDLHIKLSESKNSSKKEAARPETSSKKNVTEEERLPFDAGAADPANPSIYNLLNNKTIDFGLRKGALFEFDILGEPAIRTVQIIRLEDGRYVKRENGNVSEIFKDGKPEVFSDKTKGSVKISLIDGRVVVEAKSMPIEYMREIRSAARVIKTKIVLQDTGQSGSVGFKSKQQAGQPILGSILPQETAMQALIRPEIMNIKEGDGIELTLGPANSKDSPKVYLYKQSGIYYVKPADGKPVPINEGMMRLGGNPPADVIIPNTASPHLFIRRQGDTIVLMDNKSMSTGTYYRQGNDPTTAKRILENKSDIDPITGEKKFELIPSPAPQGITASKSSVNGVATSRYSAYEGSKEIGYIEVDRANKSVLKIKVEPGYQGTRLIKDLNRYVRQAEPETFGSRG